MSRSRFTAGRMFFGLLVFLLVPVAKGLVILDVDRNLSRLAKQWG
jgi:hypothetical protein